MKCKVVAQDGARGGAVGGAAAGAVGGALVGGPVGAVVGGAVGATTGAAVGSLSDEDRVYVRGYVVKQRAEPVTVRERIVVGEALPTTVRTYQIEGNPRLSGYRYAYVNNEYYLVNARGQVVTTIER
jgi:outer membrane lipoprotein SlyB